MAKFWNSILLNSVFFIGLGIAAVLYTLGHFYPPYTLAGTVVVAVLVVLLLLDVGLLYRGSHITGSRQINAILSNGDENDCVLSIDSTYSFPVSARIYDELPYQLNMRGQKFDTLLSPHKNKELQYTIIPTLRGEYEFGDIVVLVKSPLRMIQRKYQLPASRQIAVYPSYIHLNRYSLKNLKYYTRDIGAKKTRRIGQSMEFEHIKDYVKGDDIRYINWKASAKRGELMVNQYTEERAQQVYCLIDSGRAMQMPFDGLTLLDYAINSTLALSHIIIRKHDRAGMLHFNKRVNQILPADKAVSQLPKILSALYNLKTEFYESNFEKLYADIKFKINHRSLMVLFTNFEDMNSLQRQLPYLKGIAKNNVLLVVFFKNREIEKVVQSEATHQSDYYDKAIAEKLSFQKKLMVKELNKQGIQTLLTDPKHLTVDTIDKYLEIKSRGLI